MIHFSLFVTSTYCMFTMCNSPLFRKAVVEERTPEVLPFQHFYCSLTIQDPEALANTLFAKKIIHSRVKEQIQVPTHLVRSVTCSSMLLNDNLLLILQNFMCLLKSFWKSTQQNVSHNSYSKVSYHSYFVLQLHTQQFFIEQMLSNNIYPGGW